MAEESLKNKAVKGVGWSAIDNVAGYAVTFVVGIILARLLSPDDYGLIGIITIFTTICGCFINAGFGSALIRKKDATEDDYCTVFVVNLSMSIALYLVLFFTAPLLSTFFHREELIALIRIESLTMIITSFAIVQRTRLSKNIDFKSQAIVTIAAAVIRSIVGLSMAFAGYGVWAIVGQGISGAIITTLLLCYFNRWMPRFHFSADSFRELFGFGSKLLISDIINNVWNQCYSVVIGHYYQPATLGQYTRATMFSGLLSNNMTYVVQRVTYPVLSQMQDDKARLKSGYRRIIRATMLVSFFSLLMMAAVAKPMILVLIGPQWLEASHYLQIICFGVMLYPLHSINLNILQVFGRSDLFLKLEIYKKIIAVAPIVLGITMGIYWMLIGSVFVSIISYYINAYYSGPLLSYSITAQIKDISPSFLISLAGAGTAYIMQLLIQRFIFSGNEFWPNFGILITLILCGVAVSFSLFKRTHNPEFIEVTEIASCFLRKAHIMT